MTAVEIANLSLSDCGSNRISSMQDTSKEGLVVSAKYGAIRDAVLEAREWTFNKGRLLLAKDAAAPVFGYAFQFVIPSNVLRVVRVYDSRVLNNPDAPQIDKWVREGAHVLTDTDAPIYAEVLLRVDEGTFSPGMVLALAERLTSAIAIPLTENRQLAADHWKQYQEQLMDAAAMDGSQGRTQVLRPPALPGRRQTL